MKTLSIVAAVFIALGVATSASAQPVTNGFSAPTTNTNTVAHNFYGQ